MTQRTPLYDCHVKAKACLVDFAGWEMPLHYGSQIQEHHAVRKEAGIFDVSHMGVVDIEGSDSAAFLRYLLANDVEKLKSVGDALYTCMLNEQGGVVDDLIVYRIADSGYRLVINAGCRDKDMNWLHNISQKFQVSIKPHPELCILAVQGPHALGIVKQILPEFSSAISELKPFKAILKNDLLIARTGYTGEIGVEMIVSAQKARNLWSQFIARGVHPCGLGARDTLRLEAGLNLYGQDMDEDTSPLVSNLEWTIVWNDERNFVGRDALLKQKSQGVAEKMVGLVMEQQAGVLRHGQSVVIEGNGTGIITSGTFSPTLNCAIALARVPVTIGDKAQVERRGQLLTVKIVKPPFVKRH